MTRVDQSAPDVIRALAAADGIAEGGCDNGVLAFAMFFSYMTSGNETGSHDNCSVIVGSGRDG